MQQITQLELILALAPGFLEFLELFLHISELLILTALKTIFNVLLLLNSFLLNLTIYALNLFLRILSDLHQLLIELLGFILLHGVDLDEFALELVLLLSAAGQDVLEFTVLGTLFTHELFIHTIQAFGHLLHELLLFRVGEVVGGDAVLEILKKGLFLGIIVLSELVGKLLLLTEDLVLQSQCGLQFLRLLGLEEFSQVLLLRCLLIMIIII